GSIERHFRRDGNDLNILGPTAAKGDDVSIGAEEADDETAEQRRGDVVGVMFHFSSAAEREVFREAPGGKRERERNTGNDGGCAAAETAGNRNVVLHGESHGREFVTEARGSVLHGAKDQIFLGGSRQFSRASDTARANCGWRRGIVVRGGANGEVK